MGNSYWKNAELLNARLAMAGFAIASVNYLVFGGIIPGIF